MNKIACLLLGVFSFTACLSQNDSLHGLRFSVSAGPSLTIGEFADSHPFGLGIEFNYSNKRFGQMTKFPTKKIGALLNAGFHYLFGKSEIISGQPYNYSNYSILNLSPGIMYNPCRRGYISLHTGPVLNLFESDSEFGFNILLNGNYYFSNNLGLSPGLNWVKLSKADPIILFSIKASWNF